MPNNIPAIYLVFNIMILLKGKEYERHRLKKCCYFWDWNLFYRTYLPGKRPNPSFHATATRNPLGRLEWFDFCNYLTSFNSSDLHQIYNQFDIFQVLPITMATREFDINYLLYTIQSWRLEQQRGLWPKVIGGSLNLTNYLPVKKIALLVGKG